MLYLQICISSTKINTTKMNLIAVEIELFQNKKIYSLYPTFNK